MIITKRYTDVVGRHFRQFDLVDFTVKQSGKRFLAKRVRLRNDIFTRFREMFLRNRANSKGLVKKSVRVDDDIYDILFNFASNNDKEFFTKIINSAVVNKIFIGQIDLIDARCFKHKVTVYFTQEEYRRVQDVLEQLRNSGLRGVTFSSLVRSILYKHLGIVIEASAIERLNNGVQHNRGTTSGRTTNPINRSNSKQKNKYSVKVTKGEQ